MGRSRLPDTKKNCAACGRPLARKMYGGQLEDRGAFRRRKFCDLTCSGKAHRKSHPTLGALRKRHLAMRGMTCQKCGSAHLVSLHHIDGDPENNDPSNTMTLCGSCHTKWHWEHGKKASPRKATSCSVCGKSPAPWEHMKHGMCSLHYQRWRKTRAHADPQSSSSVAP